MITFVEFQENLPSGYFMDILIIQVHLLFGNGHFPHFEADFIKKDPVIMVFLKLYFVIHVSIIVFYFMCQII